MNCESGHTPLNEHESCTFMIVIVIFLYKNKGKIILSTPILLISTLSPNLIICTRVGKAAAGKGQIRSVRLSTCMEQADLHHTDFRKVSYLEFFKLNLLIHSDFFCQNLTKITLSLFIFITETGLSITDIRHMSTT